MDPYCGPGVIPRKEGQPYLAWVLWRRRLLPVDWDLQHDTFMNHWQAYRTRKNRKLDLESAEHEYEKPSRYRILVKVVDIFGNDTSRLLTWEVK